MSDDRRLMDRFLPPAEGFVLESLVATTYEIDFSFLEEELLASALGVRSPVARRGAFRCELERALGRARITVLFDVAGCKRPGRLSPRIDAVPFAAAKLHAKVAVQLWCCPALEPGQEPER